MEMIRHEAVTVQKEGIFLPGQQDHTEKILAIVIVVEKRGSPYPSADDVVSETWDINSGGTGHSAY